MIKSSIKSLYFALIILLASVALSCDEGKLPNIDFKTGAGYTSSDATVGKNEVVKIGIVASKAEKKDPLKKFNVSVSYNGGDTSTVIQEDLSGDQGDEYNRDVEITTRDVAGTEKYTFTVTNRDGLLGQASLTLTVQ